MKEGQFQIATHLNSGQKQNTFGYQTSQFIAVTRSLGFDKDIFGCPIWSVTHLPTGYAIKIQITKTRAFKIAKNIKSLDWDFDTPDHPKSKKIAKYFRSNPTLLNDTERTTP